MSIRGLPTADDFHSWMAEVFNKAADLDSGEQYTWDGVAMGYMIAKGVKPCHLTYAVLTALACGDQVAYSSAIEPAWEGQEAADRLGDGAGTDPDRFVRAMGLMDPRD